MQIDSGAWLGLAIILCEMMLLVFLYCIGSFYEYKFKDRTYYRGYMLPMVVFVLGLAAFGLFGLPLESVALITNASVLAVVLTFGVFLYMRMTGVAK